jgi:hypothetical protein
VLHLHDSRAASGGGGSTGRGWEQKKPDGAKGKNTENGALKNLRCGSPCDFTPFFIAAAPTPDSIGRIMRDRFLYITMTMVVSYGLAGTVG